MKLFKNSDRAVALFTITVWVIGLVMSPVSASAVFPPSGDTTGTGILVGNASYHHTFNSTQQTARLQTVLANLSQQGVDVSQAQADLTAGNTTGAAQWLMAYHKDHPDSALNGPRQHVMNATAQAGHIQTFITHLSQQGVDVSQALADLAAGNVTGAMKDLMAFHKDHPGMTANTTRQAAQLQTGVTKLAQQGVDVSEVQADIASGNVSAAMQWMAAYHTAHPVQSGNVTGMHSGNSTRWQNGGSFRPHTSGSGNQTAVHHRFRGPVQGAEKTAGASF
jgi:hypothetical protein